MTLRFAFLGITHPHSSGRFRVLQALPDVEVVGAWDADANALAAFCDEVGCDTVDVDDVLDDPSVTGVLVHSKSRDMASLGARAARAGKAVLVEKPGGSDVAALEELAAAEAASGQPVRVGYNFHHAPAFQRAREVIAAGDFGRVSMVRGHGASSHGEHRSQHLNQPADMGGGLWVIGCHVLHLLVAVSGVPDAVSAQVRKLPDWSDDTSQEDVATVTLHYPDRLGSFDFTVHDDRSWFETSEVSVYGEGGVCHFGILPGAVRWNKGTDRGWTSWEEDSFPVPWTGRPAEFTDLLQVGNLFFFAAELEEFLAAIRSPGVDRAVDGVTAADALAIARVIDAAYRSSDAGGVPQAL